MADVLPLSGMTIVVTRPQKQGEITAATLREAGADVIELPLLEIRAVECRPDAGKLTDACAAIFVSANAVGFGVPCLKANGGLPAKALIAAIGGATSQALQQAGFRDVVSPQQSIDSEGLLSIPHLQQAQVKGQHIILVKGKSESGGRRLIEETLVARGARVTVVECYERRELPVAQEKMDLLVTEWKADAAMMALSVETLVSLTKSFAAHERWLKNIVLLVPHLRVAAAAKAAGFTRVHEISMAPGKMVDSLQELKQSLSYIKAQTI